MKKSLIIFAVSLIVALIMGFLPEDNLRTSFYQSSAWYFMFAAFLLLIFSLYNSEHSLKMVEGCCCHCRAGIVAAVIVGLGFLASSPDFRILADETNLLGVSLEMHESTKCILPVESLYYYNGMRTVVREKTEMRPPAFPFMLSILHGIIGYRPANAFILNAFSAWLALFLLYLMVTRREGGLWGYVAMLALAAFPVFVQYFTSAGFEVFNLALLMLTFFLLERFLETRNLWLSVAVVASLVLLSHSRYESICAVICIFPLLLYFLPEDSKDDWREKLVFAFPLFLLPAFWLRSVTWDAARFQVESIEQAFSFANLVPNLKGMVTFFLSLSQQRFAGPVLVVLAWVGAILLLEKVINKKLVKEQRWFNASVGTCLLLHLLARLFYTQGDFSNPVTARLALVFLPVIASLAVSGLRRIESFKSPVNIAPAILIFSLALLASSWPAAHNNEGVRNLLTFREFKWARQVLDKNDVGEETVIVSNRPNMFVPFKISAITFDSAILMYDKLEKMLKNLSYSRLIAIQYVNYRTGEPEEALPANLNHLKKRVLFESQLSTAHFLRITELKL